MRHDRRFPVTIDRTQSGHWLVALLTLDGARVAGVGMARTKAGAISAAAWDWRQRRADGLEPTPVIAG